MSITTDVLKNVGAIPLAKAGETIPRVKPERLETLPKTMKGAKPSPETLGEGFMGLVS